MGRDRWRQIEELYHAALERAPDERAAFLAETCAGDSDLRREVEELLSYDGEAESFIEEHALVIEARQLDSEDLKTTQAPAPAGREIGAYRILAPLGRGGMGEVHLALDPRLGRKVALKLLPAEFAHDRERVRRFEQEARAASALNQPNIITVHDIGEIGGRRYIVEEFVDGETLRQRMAHAAQQQMRQGIEPSEAIDLALQIATALAAAHEAGITHRDIKPENVMIRPDGLVKVLDFGLAKLAERPAAPVSADASAQAKLSTEPGLVVGTVSYMSPEQARGQKVDHRTDIFSLGVVLYEMIAGRRPFEGATTSDVIAALLTAEPPPLGQACPEATAEMERIVGKCLAKDCEARYQSARELIADLKALPRSSQAGAGGADRQPETGARGEQVTQRATEQAAALERKQSHFGKLKRRKLGVALTLALLLAAVAAVYFSFFGGSGQAPAEIDSLAVLPFVNVGANPDTEYLSDGITDSLINGLSQLPKLKVMSRNSVFGYKGKETDAQQAGNTLGVRAVLTGKVTQRGDDLLISAELVDVRDNSHLWGEQYNRQLSGLLAVQAELARDISQQLRLKLSNETQQRLSKRGTENPEAYELYLKGRHHLNALTEDGNKKAVAYFQQALEKDPNYGVAYAGLADYYATATYIHSASALSPKEARAKAKEAAVRAVQLDDTLADAHTALAKIAMLQEWDWPTAEREFQRAIALNPNSLNARHWYSHYFIYLGRFAESLVESQRALALDPYDVSINYHLGFHYLYARQYEQAVAQLLKALELDRNHDSTHAILGLAYEQLGRYQEAIAELQKCKELGSLDQGGMIGHVYAVSGQRGEAEKILAQLLAETKDKHVSPYNIAKIYTGLGEQEQAFAWLEKAYAERDSNMTNLKVDQQFDRLRSDPRFTDLLRRMGIPQ